jgi:hypothetical protein
MTQIGPTGDKLMMIDVCYWDVQNVNVKIRKTVEINEQAVKKILIKIDSFYVGETFAFS